MADALDAAAGFDLIGNSAPGKGAALDAAAGMGLIGGSLHPSAGGGATTHALTANGGVALGGTAGLRQTSGLSSSGGLAFGGPATLRIVGLIDASGGVALGGSALLRSAGALTASGGLATGGSATLRIVGSVAASGGVAFGGSAALRAVSPLTASGGASFGGAASLALVSPISAAGGASFGGAALLRIAAALSASGGVSLGGSASLSTSGSMTASGGATFGGAASLAVVARLTAIGGGAFGGAAALVLRLKLAATGGASFGGSAALVTSGGITAAGGLTLGGAASLRARLALAAAGGSVFGGAAALGVVHSLAASGGVAFGGSADLDTGDHTLQVTRVGLDVAGKRYWAPDVTPAYLPELIEVIRHNWSGGCQISSAWSTDVTVALSGAEERRGLRDRPARTLSVELGGLGEGMLVRAWNAVHRACNQRTAFPLWPDHSHTTAAASAGATALALDTSYRRFYPGGRVVVFTPDAHEFATISSVSASSLTLASPLVSAWAVHARVVPMVDAEISMGGDGRFVAGRAGFLSIQVSDIAGLPAWIPPGNYPDARTFEGIPVWDVQANWQGGIAFQITRDGAKQPIGRGVVVDRYGDWPRAAYDLRITALGRESAFHALHWIDSLQGRVRPFWMPCPATLWEVTALTQTTATVRADGSIEDLQRFHRAVALRFSTHTEVRRVTSAQAVAGGHEITFSEPIPAALADPTLVLKATSAHLMRCELDSYTEEWMTDHSVEVQLPVIELVRETKARIRLSDESTLPNSGTPDDIPSLTFWAEGAAAMLDAGDVAASVGEDIERWIDKRAGKSRELQDSLAFHTRETDGIDYARFGNFADSVLFPQFVFDGDANPYSDVYGLTVFMLVRGAAAATYDTSEDRLIELPGRIDWRPTSLRMYEDASVADDDFSVTTASVLEGRGDWHVAAMTWKPTHFARVYRDGLLLGETPRAVADIPAEATADALVALKMANNSGAPVAAGDAGCGSMLIFPRALTSFELNYVGEYLGGLVTPAVSWKAIV